MKYTFTQSQHIQTFRDNNDFIKVISAVEVDQLRVAIEPHVSDFNGDVQTFKNCFFPVYPNNEGGVEFVRFYKIFDENKTHVFDLVRVENTAGTFFVAGSTDRCLELWAGKPSSDSPKVPQMPDLLNVWDLLKG
jgi:hypothetical protein